MIYFFWTLQTHQFLQPLGMGLDPMTSRSPRPPQVRNTSSHLVRPPPSPLSRHTCCTGLHWPVKVNSAHASLLAGAQSARAPDRAWFSSAPGLPNEAEVLLYAILVANIDWRVDDIDQWAKQVLSEEARRKSLGSDWTPPADAFWRPSRKGSIGAFEPLRIALLQTAWQGVS